MIKIYRLKEGRYIKQVDVNNETHSFNLGTCTIDLDFSGIWPE